MLRVVLAVDPELGVDGASVVAAWQRDEAAKGIGNATVSHEAPGAFLPGVLELVAIPLAVNLASSVLYDVVIRVIGSLRREEDDESALEVVETEGDGGDRIIVVRLRQ